MNKKLVSLFTLVAFIHLIVSCTVYTTKKEQIKTVSDWEGKDVKILGVLKTSGEKIEFPKKRPAKIYQGHIWGETQQKQQVKINMAEIEKINRDEKGNILEIFTKDGKFYRVIGKPKRTNEDTFIFIAYELISIPLSEAEMVWVKKVDPFGTFIASIGGIAATLLGLLAIVALTKESCPFIYSFDGERYIFDAEPYGGATCEGLKRTEWCGLQYLREVNGQYKIKITNEVDETQYTDELKLVVVDHPQGIMVVPDESGEIHTISKPIIPVQAYDGQGRDLMPYVSENDWIFWRTQTDGKNPEKKEDLKDELIFEFSKPIGITKAKLLFNGCNTLWASQMVKIFLELYGHEVNECYEQINNFGPAYYLMKNWNLREELYRLQIRIETESGWKPKGTIVGGGPFVSEDKVYPLDLSDVPGTTLRIKLTPPAAFWKINYLAVDYAEDLPLQITEIEALEALDHKGQDVREILVENDKNYLVMPYIGDSAELVFEAPAQNKAMERLVILKASGYYDIHLEAKGECQSEILERFLIEPGFSHQYAFKEYLKWKKELQKNK